MKHRRDRFETFLNQITKNRHEFCYTALLFIMITGTDPLTSPVRHGVVSILKRVIEVLRHWLIRLIVILSQIRMSESIHSCDAILRIQVQHLLQQIQGCKNYKIEPNHKMLMQHVARAKSGTNCSIVSER